MSKMGMENVPCLKAQKSATVFAFLHHLNFMYTRSTVLSYHDFHTENWLPNGKALLNHSTVQSNLCHFIFAHICASYTVRLIL